MHKKEITIVSIADYYSTMDEETNQGARAEFARRLREMRVLRGYRTARSFARALEIDENRYTRYERAEVEPSLELIQRICQLLTIGPNELLGHAHAYAQQRPAALGMAERHSPMLSEPRHDEAASNASRTQQADALRWLIAREIVTLSGEVGDDQLQRISQTFAKLDRPFAGLAELLSGSDVARNGNAAATGRLRELVEQLAQLLTDDGDGAAMRRR